MTVNKVNVHFQLDSAADVNTICQKYVCMEQVTPTDTQLRMWNKSALKPLGQAKLKVANPQNNMEHEISFMVVPNAYTCLLGLKTIKELGLITVNEDKFTVEALHLGNLGEANRKVDANVHPKTLPSKKMP